jgi:dTDP-4-amino-4,6-dideoxygalactose transaminase
MAQISIPLSYSKIAGDDLLRVLSEFEGKSHEELISAFENKISEITASPFVVALNSGTAAIHLALKLLGVSNGDIVPVSTFTYVGSVNPIFYLRARPALIDSEAETWNMDPELLESCLRDLSSKNKLPKAIIVVHAYGMPAKMEELAGIAKTYNIPIIEDAAEALGAKYKGQPAGNLGEMGVLSFNNNKSITTFGGGALLVKSREVYEKAKFLATQAREDRPFYEQKEVG